MSKTKYNFSFSQFLFLGILCSIPAFLFSYNHVLNLFYSFGCPLEDQGICAHAMWRNQLYPQLHPAIREFWGEFFFPMHFSPIFSITSIISKVLEINMIDFYAYFHGLSHGLLAFSLFFIFYRLYNLTSVIELSFAAVLSILFSFNGISVSSMLYPHYEMLFLPLAVFFLAFLIQKRPLIALPFFILSLSIRECSGFHLFSILFFLTFTMIIKKEKIYKPLIYYGIAAFFYSLIVLVVQKYLLNANLINFSSLYIGNPPYSHLSWELIKERTLFLLTDRGYFYIPIFLIISWSIISKRFYISFGVLALVPWFLFNFLAISTWAAGLYLYYGIYYLLIFYWPLLAIKLMYGEAITRKLKKEVIFWYSLIILSSIIFNNPLNIIKIFFLEPGVSQKHIFQRLQTSLNYNSSELGKVIVDGQVASLAPESFTKNQISYLRNVSPETRKKFFGVPNPRIQELETVDSVMFYNFGNGLIPFYILLSHLPHLYQVVGTNVHLASNKTLSQLPSFSPILVPLGYEQEKMLRKQYLSSIFKDAYYKKNVGHVQNNFEVHQQNIPGVAVYSNPIRLPKGQYCVQFGLKANAPIDPHKPILTVDIVSQNEVFIKKDFFYHDLDRSSEKEKKICFKVNQNLPHALFSIRFRHDQNAGFLIKDPKIY